MAKPWTRQSLCHNLLSAGKNELAGGVLTEKGGILASTPRFTAFYTPTPVLALALVLISFEDMYSNVDLQKATKLI